MAFGGRGLNLDVLRIPQVVQPPQALALALRTSQVESLAPA